MSCVRVVLVGLVLACMGVVEAYGGCGVPETYAYVGFWRAYDVGNWCGAEVESTIVRSLRVWGITEDSGKLVRRYEYKLDDQPEITLSGLKSDLLGRRVVLLCTHGNDPLWGAGFAVEYYKTRDVAEAVCDAYLDAGYRYDEISVGSVPQGSAIIIKNPGIARHLAPQLEPQDRLIYGDYCWSGHTRDAWSAATFLGYEYSPDVVIGCSNLNTVWRRLGCKEWPLWGLQTDDALRFSVSGMHQWGTNTRNQLDCNRGCWNIDARFVEYGAFDDIVWWWTTDEYQSVDFVVRGYENLNDNPDTICVVPAQGGLNVLRHYWVINPGSYTQFDVVERDSRGFETRTPKFTVGEKPEEWDQWLREPEIEIRRNSPEGNTGTTEVYEITQDGLVPVDLLKGDDGTDFNLRMPPRPQPPDTTNCADVVVYSTSYSFASEVAAHCQREGLKVRSFLGSTQDPEPARLAYRTVYNANNAYEDWCFIYGCSRHFPTNPLLILVGDAGSVGMVGHYWFGNCDPIDLDCDRCRGTCFSDFDITDLNFDGIPEGPVTRIPADSLWEVRLAIKAAEEFNRGINVDPGYHLMSIAGDVYYLWWESWPVPQEFLAQVAQAYQALGYNPLPILVESHFATQPEREAAARQQINGGVIELWGLAKVTSQWAWPGYFITHTDDYMNQLTTRQHLIAWIPGCHITADWQRDVFGFLPIVERFMFNDSTKTSLAACVGHLSGAYEFQHKEFAKILLEERLAAQPGTTVAEVVWRAVRRAQQYPWLFGYARSVGVMGGYVKIPTAPCAGISDSPVAKGDLEDVEISIFPAPAGANPRVTARLRIQHPMLATLEIYDVRGRFVKRLHSGVVSEGTTDFDWQMVDFNGNRVSPGVYFLRFSSPQGAQTRKIVIAQ